MRKGLEPRSSANVTSACCTCDPPGHFCKSRVIAAAQKGLNSVTVKFSLCVFDVTVNVVLTGCKILLCFLY